jgi:hypothetical protein
LRLVSWALDVYNRQEVDGGDVDVKGEGEGEVWCNSGGEVKVHEVRVRGV